MPDTVAATSPKGDYAGSVMTVALVLVVAIYTTSYDQIPALHSILATTIAALALGLAYVATLASFSRAIPLLLALLLITVITLALHWAGIPQDFNVLLRYLTAIAGIFSLHMIRLPNMTRFMAFVSMAVIAYAGYITATGGPFNYAGTVRTFPFWSGLANSSFLIGALVLVIALSQISRYIKFLWVGIGLVVLIGYGAVTAMLMVALFFAGWYFLYRGWKRTWLYFFGVLAAVAGVLFRNANSVAGADIDSLGVGAVGSGRLDSWFGRLVDFADRDFASQMMGLGPYSDYQLSDLWYWAEKNAHSDLVTVLMEFGVIGFGALLFLTVLTYKRTSGLAQVAILAIALGAAASNTFIDRPAVAVSWGLVLYASAFHKVSQRSAPEASAAVTDEPRIAEFSPSHERLFSQVKSRRTPRQAHQSTSQRGLPTGGGARSAVIRHGADGR